MCRGFSLVMMVVSLAVLGILAAIAIPGMRDVQDLRLFAASRRTVCDMRYAQDLAMRTGITHSVEFSGTGYLLTLEGGGAVEDPSFKGRPFAVDLDSEFPGVSISTSFPGNSISFDERGIPESGGSVTLVLGGSSSVLAVEENTGRISY
jgi:type II secretory pathway pseudopilin PulG